MAKRGPKPGRPALAGLSFASLQAELQRRTAKAGGLLKKRDRLLQNLSAVNAKLLAAGIEPDTEVGTVAHSPATRDSARGRRRPRNTMKLVDALAQLLKGKTMSVTEAADAVQKAGYKTKSSTFRVIVNQTLLKSALFKKVSRGQYTAKG